MGSITSTHGKKKKQQQQHRLPDVCRRLSLLLRQSSTATVLMEGGPCARSNLIDCREMQSTTKQFWFRTVLCLWRRRRSPEKEIVAQTRDSVQRSRRRRCDRAVSVDRSQMMEKKAYWRGDQTLFWFLFA
ncbi:hypothetical protein MRB53_031137 [Persea americana]|uniref:Uncharacterized protein n=1 Tax=Persea americana TaxID=3435 RepID=A0ACC2KNG2_PERAE|nr:hypothetical protein MRB53_031137 [Persea americana]